MVGASSKRCTPAYTVSPFNTTILAVSIPCIHGLLNMSYKQFLTEEEEQVKRDTLVKEHAEADLRTTELHKLQQQQTFHSLDTIKRRWHKLPKPKSKFNKKATKVVQSEYSTAKASFVSELARIKRAKKLQCKARIKELNNKIKQVNLVLEGNMYKQKRRFAYQRKTIIKSASLKDWYAKQVALEEVCKLKDNHLEHIRRINEEHKKTIRILKEEALQDLRTIVSQKKKTIGNKKYDLLSRKGWTINETIKKYEDILEFEEEQENKYHTKDSDETIAHLMHSGGSNRQYVLDHEQYANNGEDGTEYFSSELYRSGLLK